MSPFHYGMEVIKVQPDIDRETLLLGSCREDSQVDVPVKEVPTDQLTFIKMKKEDMNNPEGGKNAGIVKIVQQCKEKDGDTNSGVKSQQEPCTDTINDNILPSPAQCKSRISQNRQKLLHENNICSCTACGVVFRIPKTFKKKGQISLSQICKNCTKKGNDNEEPINLANDIIVAQQNDESMVSEDKNSFDNSMKTHSCSECGKKFTRLWAFKKHYCMREKPFVCEVCGKQFTQSRNLLVHSRSHTGERPFVCNICSRAFSYSGDLKIHIRIHTGEKPHVCDVCHKAFNKQGKLTIHYRIHTGEKPYVCKVCKKGFSESQVLKRHYHTHTGEKPHECPVCHKGFTKPGKLKVHFRIHTGEKPFVCNVCNKGFSEAQVLKKHYRIHTGEKPYMCNVCDKRFNDTQVLKEHYRTHTGEKPYVCSICMKSFAFSKSLKKHSRIHTAHPITHL